MARTLPTTGCPEPFELTPNTLARLERDRPTIDIAKTLDKFVLNAEAKGWMYRNWQAAFVNYIDNGEKFGGVFYKQGIVEDPKWARVLSEARKFGFRLPLQHETPGSYETQLNTFKGAAKDKPTARDMSAVTNLFKGVPS